MAGAVQEQAGGMAAAKKKPLMAVHDGAFHADDCTAYSIMKHLHPSLELVRTRDPEVIATADYVMDVQVRRGRPHLEEVRKGLREEGARARR